VPATKAPSDVSDPVVERTRYCAPGSPPPPDAVDAIVTDPFEPEVIVMLDPAMRYDDPSESFVRDPDRLAAYMFLHNLDAEPKS
jgi:hypothetical protein